MTAGPGETWGKDWGRKWVERKAARHGERCSLVKLQSERERCLLQISQSDLQAWYSPESEESTVYFLLAQCSDMSLLFSVFPVEFCCWWRGLRVVCIRGCQTSRIACSLCCTLQICATAVRNLNQEKALLSYSWIQAWCLVSSSIWHDIKFVYQICYCGRKNRLPLQSHQENGDRH